jgi:sulfite reductase alpha subunit-like flavoprotein
VQEWFELQRQGVLCAEWGVMCAFSRDQPAKRYVQHCIRERWEELWRMLHENGAAVFVCGSANSMPAAVADAFAGAIAAGLPCAHSEAKALQRRLEAAKRYCVETWS